MVVSLGVLLLLSVTFDLCFGLFVVWFLFDYKLILFVVCLTLQVCWLLTVGFGVFWNVDCSLYWYIVLVICVIFRCCV